MYKKKNTGKRILSALLTVAVAVPLLAGGGYKDMSTVQAATMPGNPRTSNGVTTWDCVWFGVYPQSSTVSLKLDPIKWRVLSVNGNDAFLISDTNLDTKRYSEKKAEVPWEKSTIRSWLNGYSGTNNESNMDFSAKSNFINTAFNQAEQKALITTAVDNPGNEYYKGAAGNVTNDKIYLLSYKEAMNPAYGFAAAKSDDPKEMKAPPLKYITEDVTKIRTNTIFVGAGGSGDYRGERSKHQQSASKADCWWLRSSGRTAEYPMYVDDTGSIVLSGIETDMNYFAVCPVLHLDLTNTDVWSFAGTVSSDGTSTPGEAAPTRDTDVQQGEDIYTPNSDGKTAEYKPAPDIPVEEVVIPEKATIGGKEYTVTSIADNAFQNDKTIKTIVIGDNIKTIGKNAFKGCTNLKSVTIGDNVTVIGESAFMGCSNLATVKMGSNVLTIKAKAFYKCKKLKAITIPSTVNKIGKQAFFGCKKLKNITIQTSKLTNAKVGSKAFKGTHSKATVKVPSGKVSSYKKLLKSKGVSAKATIKK